MSFFASRPVAYFLTRKPRLAHSAKASQSRTVHRLNAEYHTRARPSPSRVGYVPNIRGVCSRILPAGNIARSLNGTPGSG